LKKEKKQGEGVKYFNTKEHPGSIHKITSS